MSGARRLLPFAAAGLGVAAAALSSVLWPSSGCHCPGVPPADEAAAIGTGLLYVLVGPIAWLRPGTERVGVLMTGVGITWYAFVLRLIPSPWTYTLGELTVNASTVLLGHLAVVFPTGRLRSRLDRAVIALLYGVVVPARLGFMFFEDPSPRYPTSYNLLLVRPDATLYRIGSTVFAALAAALTLLVTAVVLWHWHRGTRVARRALAPLLWAAIPSTTCILALSALDVTRSSIPLLLGLGAIAVGFLVGVLRTELDRAAVGRLVIALAGAPAPAELRDALARTLHDPSLTLAYWLPERAAYGDRDGLPIRLPGAGSNRTVSVLRSRGQPIAAAIYDSALEHDPELVRSVMAAARLALENDRFLAELRGQIAEVRASRARIVAAADAERRQIERGLRDRVEPRLAAVTRALSRARDAVGTGRDAALGAALDRTVARSREAAENLRELARGVHPAVLAGAGLVPALEVAARSLPLPVTIEGPAGAEPPSSSIEAAAYFVTMEALTNVVKHAGATAVTVSVAHADGGLRVEVRDDGAGGAAPRRGGSGLQGMADRVDALDGVLEVLSPPGGGTRVRFWLPAGGHPAR